MMTDIPERNRNYFAFAVTEIEQVQASLDTRFKGSVDVAEKAGLVYDIERLCRATDYINQGLEEKNGTSDTHRTKADAENQ